MFVKRSSNWHHTDTYAQASGSTFCIASKERRVTLFLREVYTICVFRVHVKRVTDSVEWSFDINVIEQPEGLKRLNLTNRLHEQCCSLRLFERRYDFNKSELRRVGKRRSPGLQMPMTDVLGYETETPWAPRSALKTHNTSSLAAHNIHTLCNMPREKNRPRKARRGGDCSHTRTAGVDGI